MLFQRLLVRIAAALAKRKIPYMIIGGQAVLRYGEPRATKDIDITLGLGPEDIQTVLAALSTAKLRCLVQDPEDFARTTMVVPARDDATGIRVDFILSFSDYERKALERAENVAIGRSKVRFASLEDLLIHKMVAGRPRDLEDIESILLKNAVYDIKYIVSWLRAFDLSLETDYTARFRSLARSVRARR